MGQILEFKRKPKENLDYKAKLLGMSKLDLLEEMVSFQEEQAIEGNLTEDAIVRGLSLFKELHRQSETSELRELTGAYKRHLEHEWTYRYGTYRV